MYLFIYLFIIIIIINFHLFIFIFLFWGRRGTKEETQVTSFSFRFLQCFPACDNIAFVWQRVRGTIAVKGTSSGCQNAV